MYYLLFLFLLLFSFLISFSPCGDDNNADRSVLILAGLHFHTFVACTSTNSNLQLLAMLLREELRLEWLFGASLGSFHRADY